MIVIVFVVDGIQIGLNTRNEIAFRQQVWACIGDQECGTHPPALYGVLGKKLLDAQHLFD